MGGADHALPRNLRYKEEVVAVIGDDIRVNDSTWLRVAQSVRILAVKEALRDSFVDKHNHEFDGELLCRIGIDSKDFLDRSLKLG